MQYQIKGTPLPVVECTLESGESIICEAGSMSWMSSNMKMETNGGGLGNMFSKAFSGEKMFQNIYTATGGPGMIAFASSFPGAIRAVEMETRPATEASTAAGTRFEAPSTSIGVWFSGTASPSA